MPPRLPDFLIIGAAKSGTSTLHEYLKLQPRIFMTEEKEPCFFDPQVSWSRGWDWYASLFDAAESGQLCGESSTNYARYPQVLGVPARIAARLPQVKLIYLLRHPIERAYSHYVHRHSRELFRGQSFTHSFEQFVELDPMCVDSSDYALQIAQYREYFPRESLLVLRLEDLEADPQALLARVLRFLGVDEAPRLPPARQLFNESAAVRRDHVRARVLERWRQRLPEIQRLSPWVPQPLKGAAFALLRLTAEARGIEASMTPPPMRPATRAQLAARYRESNCYLAREFGIDTSAWNA